MILSVASGKGGTGKTTIAVSLALSSPVGITLLDCDVEEPNSRLFLGSQDWQEEPVTVPVPVIDETLCTACGECARFCEFKAIVHIGKTVMVFNDLCHSCGGCALVCPVHAIHEEEEAIGSLEYSSSPVRFIQGTLSVGKAMSPPVIRAVKRKAASGAVTELTIIDSPPGTSCPMCTAVSGSDAIILVTEPTPFGLHDLDLAVKTVRAMKIPFGVVINRSDSGDDRVVQYCAREGIPVLMQIPEDRRIAQGYARGVPLIESAPEYRDAFAHLVTEIISGTCFTGGVL